MKFLGKPYTLIKFLKETHLVDEDEKKKVLRKEFDAFQRLQGKSFKQMTTRISLIILMCENSGVEISNEEKVTTLLHGIGSQMWAQTVLTIWQTAEGKNWNFEWMKKDLVEKEKVMKEIMNKSHLANVAHQTFASPAPVSLSHGGGLKLHLQSRQFVDLNQTAGEVSTPWKLADVIAHLSSQTASTWLSSIAQTFNCRKKTKKNINHWKNNFNSQKKTTKISTIKKIISMVKKKQKKIDGWKKKRFFFVFFFNCWKTKLPLVFCFVFPLWNWKKGWKECFLKKKKRICFSFYFFIIKWIYNKKFLFVWINQQNKFFFFLPQHHHLQLQHTTFSFKLNNPIIKRITNTHFFSFFLFFFVLFLQLSPFLFNQKINKSKERP